MFAAWLNHVDAKAINSLDTLVTENGRSYVRHNLIDFGSALGSGGVGAGRLLGRRASTSSSRARSRKQMVGFGFYLPKWHTTPFYEARVDRPAAAATTPTSTPTLWKPRVPNQAFLHARADDKFWAAQKLVALTTDMLRAAVRSRRVRRPGRRGVPGARAGRTPRRDRAART